LPATRSSDTSAPAEAQDLHVLLVDDNVINRKVGSKILKRLGYAPVVVSSGADAVESCKAADFDIVLMDIEMPDMDGIAATARIREEVPAARIPYVVALTANAMASERENYLQSGMDDYLSKPIDVDALTASLQAAADRRTARLAARSA
jgi:CheY-like chemotaxis protein